MSELKDLLVNISEEVRTKVIPENIKAGVQIFDVEGEYSGLDTSDATATAEDIAKDKTAYVNGEKITGTLEVGGDNNAKIVNPQTVTATTHVNFTDFLEKLDLTGIDFSEYSAFYNQTFKGGFYNFSNIKEIIGLHITGNIDASLLFYGCTSLEKLEMTYNSSYPYTNSMFFNCVNLENFPEMDTSNVTIMASMFQGCSNMKTPPNLNTSNVTRTDDMFNGCASLVNVPQYDTSNVTNMSKMYYLNTSLVTVPQYNTSKVSGTGMKNMFYGCPNLSNESLNNILAMCTNAISYTGTKTLKYIGLTQEQATKCQSLSNYQALLDAGWTTGY